MNNKTQDALDALISYQQADEEGIMVLVSRQAVDEVVDMVQSNQLQPIRHNGKDYWPDANGWYDIECVTEQEYVSYLVYVPRGAKYDYDCMVQVSNFEGRMYPDAMQSAVDWSDQVVGATHWKPLPEPPESEEK